MGLIEKLQAKLELFRLEQRYTRNRHRRSTFISNAVYKDGEYVYQTPNTTGSSTNSSASASASAPWSPGPAVVEEEPSVYGRRSLEASSPQPAKEEEAAAARSAAERKKMHRWSSMPGFGSSSTAPSGQPGNHGSLDWRSNPVGGRAVR